MTANQLKTIKPNEEYSVPAIVQGDMLPSSTGKTTRQRVWLLRKAKKLPMHNRAIFGIERGRWFAWGRDIIRLKEGR